MSVDASITVIGAGVVGLAVAARLAPAHPDLVLLERERKHGTGVSSRNSEVIHAGLYYPTGSIKARLCVAGNHMLYELCGAKGIPHRRIGKLITASCEAELETLASIEALARANDVPVEMLSAAGVKELEPNVHAVAALHSPSTGLVSARELMDYLFGCTRDAGALYAASSEVVAIERLSSSYRLTVKTGAETSQITTRCVVNAGGLECDSIAAMAGIDIDAADYRLFYSKGMYFGTARPLWKLVERLIYPASEPFGCPHTAQDLDGRLRFGPDTVQLPDRTLDYAVDDSRRRHVGSIVRKFLPQISDDDLVPDHAGVSPRLRRNGGMFRSFRDFIVQEESARGLPGFVNLIGIDSPGLTSSLAIAAEVERLLA